MVTMSLMFSRPEMPLFGCQALDRLLVVIYVFTCGQINDSQHYLCLVTATVARHMRLIWPYNTRTLDHSRIQGP